MIFKIGPLLGVILLLSQCNSVKHPALSNKYLPAPAPLIHRSGYILSYDGKTRNANWVYEELTPASLEGNTSRDQCDFTQDPLIPASMRTSREDYHGSGFDKGHLCPAADAKSSPETMQETFYLSNISPQHPLLNRKMWLKLEKYVRQLAKSSDIVYVITGPLFLPHTKKDGKRYVQYQVIGKNNVAVPTHFFKVLQVKKGGNFQREAYIIPNQPQPQEYPLSHFAVTLDKVEQAAGILFK